ncbi:MAG: DUF1836 domain-containing protein [Clostridia bacterium]|nr:DUF1836 domain-containing protein [Clostridia bacterium]
MVTTLPGTTIEVSTVEVGTSRRMFDGIFATGGITLSQVSVMTGLEPHVVQNWVKRGFVSSPVKRMYSKNQFARIVIINMLRESLHLDRICTLLGYLNGCLNDESDDVIGDSELYHMYTDLIAEGGGMILDSESVRDAAEAVAATYTEPVPGAKRRLVKILQVMANAHYASLSRRRAEELLSQLDY